MTSPISIHIVEDEMIIAEDLRDMLEELGYQVKGISANYHEALVSLHKDQPDMVLLDVTLSGPKTGIDLAHVLNDPLNIPFIFLTSHSDRQTIELARETRPCAYLIKPFEKEDVFAAIEMAMARLGPALSAQTSPNIFIPQGRGRIRVSVDDVVYAEGLGNYITIYTSGEQFMLRKTLKEAASHLLHHSNFIRIHKSFIVNRTKVKKVTSEGVLLANGKLVPVGRTYSVELKKL